jgi:hypothetical protein
MAKRKERSEASGRQGRNIRSYERHPGNRLPTERLLIVCEGEQTEPNYFRSLRRHLRLQTVQVVVEGIGKGHVSLVEDAIDRQRRDTDLDEIWCVFDVETASDSQAFLAAVDKARRNQFRLAVSNPAFEYWYLLHYIETDQPFRSADELRRRLKEYMPGYEKNCDAFTLLPPNKHSEALTRAERLLRKHPSELEFPNPSTTVFELIKKLLLMSERRQ